LHLSSEIRTTRPRYGYRIRIPRANGWRKRSYRTSPSRAWRPLLSAVVDQHLLERVPGHLPRVGLPAIRWPSSAPRVRCSVLKRTRLSGVRLVCRYGRTGIDKEQPKPKIARRAHSKTWRPVGSYSPNKWSGSRRRSLPYATKKIIARFANRHISGTFWDYTRTITGSGMGLGLQASVAERPTALPPDFKGERHGSGKRTFL
jgi:hypothetical protein